MVWVNWVRTGEIMINSKEGGKCVETTQAPSGFIFKRETVAI